MEIRKIEKNFPFPEVVSKYNYPWPDMEVGNSVLIQTEDGEPLSKLKRRVWSASHYYGIKANKKFKTLLLHEKNGIRVWRIE